MVATVPTSPQGRLRHLVCVVAARPNFMKMAPILAALQALRPAIRLTLVHTGQHYDAAMNEQHFTALGLARPQINLEVGSGSHARQTAEVLTRFAPLLEADPPGAVLVVGDVNSTLACALAAAQLQIPLLHVEAGLRSFDRAMPEEINRVLTDQLAELLFVSEASGMDNLRREGVAEHRLHWVGNVMIDSLLQQLPRAVPLAAILAQHAPHFLRGIRPGPGHALVTLHRPSNVDHLPTLRTLMETLVELSSAIPVIFTVHPRTRARLDDSGLGAMLARPRILQLPPVGYLDMLGLLRTASVVLTDSGGLQEESTALGLPCITLRDTTERPVTVSEGSNTLAGTDPALILALCDDVLRGTGKAGQIPRLWDGHAASRIAAVIDAWLAPAPAHHRAARVARPA